MKTNIGLVEYCKAQLGKPYWWGTFGQTATESLYNQKKKQYPRYYTANDFKSQFGQRVHDCVGLIKGYLWSEALNSTPIYNSKQDKDVNGMKANCTETGDIKTLPELKGVLVFMKGHVGIYIGNGEVIEARGHSYGVVKTKLTERKWTSWGKLRWIEYKEVKMFEQGQEKEAIDYLVEQGRITDKEQALQKLELIKNEGWTYIKWANDVKELLG